MTEVHDWLGREFKTLLSHLQAETRSIRVSVTRPYSHSYGDGELRVIRVRADHSQLNLLLAYERYISPPRQEGNRKSRSPGK